VSAIQTAIYWSAQQQQDKRTVKVDNLRCKFTVDNWKTISCQQTDGNVLHTHLQLIFLNTTVTSTLLLTCFSG